MRVEKTLFLSIFSVIIFSFSCTQPTCYTEVNKGVYINELLINNTRVGFDSDFRKFSKWIEIYNANSNEIDISGWEISIEKDIQKTWVFPDSSVISAKGYFKIFADGRDTSNHTNFKLNQDVKCIRLLNKGDLVDSVIIPKNQLLNVSYGRENNGSNKWVYFDTPSFENCNSNEKGIATLKRNKSPKFSIPAGIYNSHLEVKIISNPECEIRYTLDGSSPNRFSLKYQNPIKIENTSSIRAIAVSDSCLSSEIVTGTYFINPVGDLPLVSICTDHESLWDSDYGIYKNSIKNEKRTANFEYFDDGKKVISQVVDLSLHGNVARYHPQKAFRLTAKKKYGNSLFEYPFFDNKKANSFQSLLLRAGGHADHFYTQFRDELAQHLHVGHTEIDFQGSRPVVVHLNGEFWGVYNLKEKLNADYITSNYGLKKGEFSMLEQSWQNVKTGSKAGYKKMLKFIDTCEKSLENYKIIQSLMDIDNFIDYNILQIYVANVDWPSWNIKYWKQDSNQGKWKWIITDLDFGFDEGARVTKNMIDYATSAVQTRKTNTLVSTLLLRKLFEFKEFKDEFIQRMAVSLNVIYNTNRVLERIEQEKAWRLPVMPMEIEKWSGKVFKSQWGDFSLFNSLKEWEKHIERVREFARKRPEIVRSNFLKHFELEKVIQIKTESTSGLISINSIRISEKSNAGKYFSNVPIRLFVYEDEGAEFAHWMINGKIYSDKSLDIKLSSDSKIIAVYK